MLPCSGTLHRSLKSRRGGNGDGHGTRWDIVLLFSKFILSSNLVQRDLVLPYMHE